MTFKDLLKSMDETLFRSDIALPRILLCLFFALILGLFIFIVYRYAVKNEFYSKDFNKSLVLMSVITSAIVLSIQSSLVISLGMVGALSIVRYRTAIKSSLDLVFIFWSISVGIISGASLFMIAIVLCVVVTFTLLLLDKIESPISLGLLIVRTNGMDNANTIINSLKKKTSFLRLKNKTVSKDKVELVLEYKNKHNVDLDKELSNMNEIINYSMMNYDRETRI